MTPALFSRSKLALCRVPRATKSPFVFFTADAHSVPKENVEPEKMGPLPVTFEDVSKASFMIRSGIVHTPCDYSTSLSEICKTNVYLKKDFMQLTGSFKERGARFALLSLSDEEKKTGVVLASAGNHALAMAWHGMSVGRARVWILRVILHDLFL